MPSWVCKMRSLHSLIFNSLLWEVVLHLSHALGQPSENFISIDCGYEEEIYEYYDMKYISDAKLMKFGEIKSPDSTYIADGWPNYLRTLRTFPKGKRNCYTLQPIIPGSKYLIRPNFLYGNFDGSNSFLQFDLYLENTFAPTIDASVSDWKVFEFIVKATRSYITLCLCKTNEHDHPFISAIELRPITDDEAYPVVNATLALNMEYRQNYGRRDGKWYRYPDDIWDRFCWSPQSNGLGSINTSFNFTPTNFSESVSSTDSKYQPPLVVMQTVDINLNSSKGIQWSSTSIPEDAYFFMCIHFAELKKLNESENREFNITLDSNPWRNSFNPIYRVTTSICSSSIYRSKNNLVEYTPTSRSTLSPIVNAMELYSVILLSSSTTNDADASSLVDIRDKYQISKAWTGDPCLPINYTWEGLVCSNDMLSPRVISLDLSNSGLSGEIPQSLANISAIVSLNLSGNNLTGNIPIFLVANLSLLSKLDLSDNDLSGCVPDELIRKNETGDLMLSVSGNEKLSSLTNCSTSKSKGSSFSSSSASKSKGKIRAIHVAVLPLCYFLCSHQLLLWL